jgi:hypothetical protein
MAEGMLQGRRPELVGVGLIRSLGYDYEKIFERGSVLLQVEKRLHNRKRLAETTGTSHFSLLLGSGGFGNTYGGFG